jgi:hypothetical protein
MRDDRHIGARRPRLTLADGRLLVSSKIAGHDSPWSRCLRGLLYRHAERYRYIALRGRWKRMCAIGVRFITPCPDL